MTNNDLRRRKQKDQNGRPAPLRKKKDVNSSGLSIQRSFMCLIVSATILTLFTVFYADNIPWQLVHKSVDHIAKQFGHFRPVYAVVIDAGSTGSRVIAFSFHESFFGNQLILDKELFRELKPGMSAFADNPEKGVKIISNLLDMAKQEIPKEYWNQTRLILKATAGLRLLPQEKAEKLLNSVRDLFKHSPFITTSDSVEIMDGRDEGIFSWFTVNFLLGKNSIAKTVAALDLGGGSTQVTFAATTPNSLAQKQFIHEAIFQNEKVPVYTHSYLGLGLMAARKEIVAYNQGDNTEVTSECINHIIQNRKFHYGGVDYFVSGPKSNYSTNTVEEHSHFSIKQNQPIVNFHECSKIITKYVQSNAATPEELPTKDIFAFSYYYDRAAEVGLIEEEKGAKIKVDDFEKAAKKVCNIPNNEQPFMCLDITFIWILLRKGFGLDGNTDIYLFDTINGHEISWALGAAYNMLRS